MSQSNKPKSSGGTAKKPGKKKKQNQFVQVLWMVGAVAVCAVLITWTVMLMRERLTQSEPFNEQISRVDLMELSSEDEPDPADTTVTSVPEFTDRTTEVTTDTSDSVTTDTTPLTDATAPPRVTVQDPHFVKATTAKPKETGTGQSTEPGATTETQTVPADAPSGEAITYNQLLALYLAAMDQGGTAYFADGSGNAEPTVILHGDTAYYAVSAADDFSIYNRLGGTGDANEHPWQTGDGFRIYQYDDASRYLYYTSQGNNYQVLGYFDLASCENVWARLHYYQLGVSWQAEYHIVHSFRPDSLNGSQTEIYSGTCDADALYAVSAEFEQILAQELQNRGISSGSWSSYAEITANSQSDALWSKAGSYNSSFTLQTEETYAVVHSGGEPVTLYETGSTASDALGILPDGALVGVSGDALPLGSGWIPVSAQISGTPISGYLQTEWLLSWFNH